MGMGDSTTGESGEDESMLVLEVGALAVYADGLIPCRAAEVEKGRARMAARDVERVVVVKVWTYLSPNLDSEEATRLQAMVCVELDA